MTFDVDGRNLVVTREPGRWEDRMLIQWADLPDLVESALAAWFAGGGTATELADQVDELRTARGRDYKRVP